ncbi:MAG TPA: cupin domain-containing protein [Pyrinomonadaceae bacterium]|nr:cupin domain-containing protein [Pyrinomonadaceae bacterium]
MITKWNLKIMAGAVALGAVALGLIGLGVARGQTTGLQIIALAQGFSAENNLNLHVKGPSDVLQTLLVFQAGGDTGWHTHPGPVVVVVKTGALTEYHSNGCVTVHPAGSVFFEKQDEVHRAVNQTGGEAQAYVTFISPTGIPPLIPASDPGGVCGR